LSLFCLVAAIALPVFAAETLTFDNPECAGMSGLRAHWDAAIPVAEDGERLVKDAKVKDRGQTAVWGGDKPGPLAFDAVHRSLLVRFPGAAAKIAEALAAGKAVAKAELVLPYLDEELWPQGQIDFPRPDGYRYRMNWGCDKLYRNHRPNWHAVAWALRKPWAAGAETGPTYNASIRGAVYWKRFGASDETEDRFPSRFGPTEVSSYKPEGRMDVTAVLTDPAFGKTQADRLRTLSDCGFLLGKLEVYDARYFQGAYEWAISTGPRAILIKKPRLLVTLKAGPTQKVTVPPPAGVPAIAARHAAKPIGAPTAVVPTPAEVARLNAAFMAKPTWMTDSRYKRVLELMMLGSGSVQPFYYRVVPKHVVNKVKETILWAERKRRGKRDLEIPDAKYDYAVYLAWLDWIHGRPPRYWEGHLTAANNIVEWYNFHKAMPGPVRDSVRRCWTAWLMPDRETMLDPKARRHYDDTSGKLVHPMVDDPRVGRSKAGKKAEWNQGDTYHKLTGDWRGNKSYYRSGFTREMSTANFNSSASSGALLNGQIIGSERAMADGRAGLMQFPFWLWTHNAGVGQEYIDHYYWAIATAGNKLFADFCGKPEDRMAGWSIITKTVNDLANGYHPNLKKLIGPASRTYYQHVLGQQDGLYHVLHVISERGALCDVDTGVLPRLTLPKNKKGRTPRPKSAWGHDYPPATVALQSLSGPWADPWADGLLDDKPLPWSSLVEKKPVSHGDWVSTWFGEHYGLSSIRRTPQRIHVLAHWRRKAERPSSMTGIGTLDMRMGYNQTRIANDGSGVISKQGEYRTYQHAGTVIMLARAETGFMGQKKKEIRSVQCTAALFNYEQPKPSWKIRVDGKPVGSLPAKARYGQIVTIHDGVTYLAVRPIPGPDLGRDAEVVLEPGVPQEPAHHGEVNIQPALLVNAYLYKKDDAIGDDAMARLKDARTGFVVEMGDVKEFGSFEAFEAHARRASLIEKAGEVTYTTGKKVLKAGWDAFTVDGTDPYAYAKEKKLWQDTPLTQMGRARLEKNGAIVERGTRHPELNLFLQTLPKRKLYVALNLLPNYLDYRFREPGGVRIVADGACSMGRWAVKDSREIDIKYHAFGGQYRPKEQGVAATVLFVSGTRGKPQVKLNGKDVTASLKAWKQDGAAGWLIPLTGALPPDDKIAERLRAAGKALER
jgi:hypothetical protein